MSDGIHGHGTVLSIGGTTVGNIISISGPEQARDSVDKSTMDSTAKWREFIPGMLDGGEISFDVNYDGTTIASLLNSCLAATAALEVIVTFADGTSAWTCDAFMTKLGHAIPFDDKITQSVTIKAAGTPTHTFA